MPLMLAALAFVLLLLLMLLAALAYTSSHVAHTLINCVAHKSLNVSRARAESVKGKAKRRTQGKRCCDGVLASGW